MIYLNIILNIKFPQEEISKYFVVKIIIMLIAVKIGIKNKKISDSSNEAVILSELEGIEKILNFYYLEVQGEKNSCWKSFWTLF